MNEFEKAFEYYLNLYSDIPEKYKNFGNFGECVWYDMIEEGLITSYPKEKVITFLKSLGIEDRTRDESDTIDVIVSTRNLNEYRKDLDNRLKVYGYYVSNYVREYGGVNKHKLIIEPIKPTSLIPDKKNGDFYHITHKSNLDKIMKIGLTPKDSKTLFSHPGNRIYLIQTKDFQLLDQLKYMLADSKRRKLEYENYPQHWLDELSQENMVTLKINTDGLKLFNDPMFPSYMKTFFACFTHQNISPERIEITNY